MRAHRAPVDPAPHAERRFELDRVQQQQGLVGFAGLLQGAQAGVLDGVDLGRLAGLGQQQDFVGVARTQAAPALVGVVAEHEHEVVLGFECVEHLGAGRIGGLAVLLLRLGAHLGSPNAAGAAIGF